VLAYAEAAGLPPYEVTPAQGKLLTLLARVRGARSILELGTLGGYSTICLARALPPGGRLVTVEVDPHFADVARTNLERAGVARVTDVRVGPALEVLDGLTAERSEPFDFVFVDADKENTALYFTRVLELTRPGSVIVVDNVVRAGAVVDATSEDENVQGIRRFNEALACEARVSATTIQTVGRKGHDGFTLALVTE
jgi:predicted O-methyltransferase YrrM